MQTITDGFILPPGTVVTIVGLGLMGGSLALALKEQCADVRVFAVTRRSETIDLAMKNGWIDGGSQDWQAVVPLADLVVLATPVRKIAGMVGEFAACMPKRAILTDLGSTKIDIVKAMQAAKWPERCVGGHPMCGKEKHGLEAADAHLYQGATWAICPAVPESAAVASVAALAQAVGAKPMLAAPEEHDAIVARTSHLPYLAAACLTRAVAETVQTDGLLALSAGGYRDTTRLAASDTEMMLDILLANRQHVLAGLSAMQRQLDDLGRLLANADEAGLRQYLSQAKAERRLG